MWCWKNSQRTDLKGVPSLLNVPLKEFLRDDWRGNNKTFLYFTVSLTNVYIYVGCEDVAWFLYNLECHYVPFFFCFNQTCDDKVKGLFVFILPSLYENLYKPFFERHPSCPSCTKIQHKPNFFTIVTTKRHNLFTLNKKAYSTHFIVTENVAYAYHRYMHTFTYYNKYMYLVKRGKLYKLLITYS